MFFHRSNKPTKETWYLRRQDFENVISLVQDLEKHVTYPIVFGGSLMQRIDWPAFGEDVAGNHLYDLDLALTGGSLDDCPFLPTIKKDFYVMDIVESKQSYYFGMIHKKTKIWVDVFSEPYSKKYHKLTIGEKDFLRASIESQLVWMARDIISRIAAGVGIHRKHIKRLIDIMNAQCFDYQVLEEEFQNNKDYLLKKVPLVDHQAINHVQDFIEYAVQKGKLYPKSYQSFSKAFYPDSVITTSNGISIEPKKTFRKLFFWHVLEFLRNKFFNF